MYDKELLMAILIASTALTGFSGTILTPALREHEVRLLMSISVIIGFIVIIISCIWFLSPNKYLLFSSVSIFIIQAIIFLVIYGIGPILVGKGKL